MSFFKRWKENFIRNININEVLYYAKEYREIEIEKPIKVNEEIYIVKYASNLIFFMKKSNWKKYIGVRKVYLEDSAYNTYYKSDDLKDITNCNDIPSEMTEEMYDELVKYKDEIHSLLGKTKHEEFYK